MKNITQSLKVTVLALVFSFGLSYVYAWTAPTISAPGGNVSAPINTSTVDQVKGSAKTGGLGVEGLIRGYSNAIFDGNVGIGTASPTFARLVVESDSSQYNLDNGIISAQVSGTSKRVNVGYDTSVDAGYVQAVQSGTGNKPLLLNANGGNVGIGTISPAQKLSVAGTIESTSGGIKFPDGSVQTTAAGSDSGTICGQTVGVWHTTGGWTWATTKCKGFDPSVSCPPGYTQTFPTMGNTYVDIWWCAKN